MIRRMFGSTSRSEVESELISSLYIEAENAEFIGSNWINLPSVEATGNVLIAEVSPNPADPSTVFNNINLISYNLFNFEPGLYKIYLKVRISSTGSDSIFHRLDNLPWQANPSMFSVNSNISWQILQGNTSSAVEYSITSNIHTLGFYIRESGIIIDKIYITKNGDTPI